MSLTVGSGVAQVTLLCAIASVAGEYVEKIAQLRLHNDTDRESVG